MTYTHTVLGTTVNQIGITRSTILYPDVFNLAAHLQDLEEYDELYGRKLILDAVTYDAVEFNVMIEDGVILNDHDGDIVIDHIVEPADLN